MSTLLTLSDFRNVSTHAEQIVVLQGNAQSPQLSSVDKASVPDMAALHQDAVLSALKDALLSDPNYRGMGQTISTLLDDIRAEVTESPQGKTVTGGDVQSIMDMVNDLTAASLETHVMAEMGQHVPPGPESPSRQTQFEAELQSAYINQARVALHEGKPLSEINIGELARTLASQWAAKDALVESKASFLSPQSMQRLRQWHESCPRSLEQLAETVAQLSWLDKTPLLPEDKAALYNACWDNRRGLERHDFSIQLAAAKENMLTAAADKWGKVALSKASLQVLLDKEEMLSRSHDLQDRAVAVLHRIDTAQIPDPLKGALRAKVVTDRVLSEREVETLLVPGLKKGEVSAFVDECLSTLNEAARLDIRDSTDRKQLLNKGFLLHTLAEALRPLAENPEVSLAAFHETSAKCSKLVDLLPAMNAADMKIMLAIVCDPRQHEGEIVHDVVDYAMSIVAKRDKLEPDMARSLDSRGCTRINHRPDEEGAGMTPELDLLDKRMNLLLMMQDAHLAPDKADCLYRLLANHKLLVGGDPRKLIENAVAQMGELEAAGLPNYVSYEVFRKTLRRDVNVGSVRFAATMEEARERYAKEPDPVRELTNPWMSDLGMDY